MNTDYEAFAAEVDLCKKADELKEFRQKNTVLAMRNEFWRLREVVLNPKSTLEKEQALTKIQWIQHFFGCDIPLRGAVNQFRAPHGFYGIFISSRARIGKGCTIFQQATIGSNLLRDSKGSGFPVIGENVFIGAGAQIIGNVVIGDNARIGANCCVTEDVPPNSVVVGGRIRIIRKDKPLNNTFMTPKAFRERRFKAAGAVDVMKDAENLRVEKALPEDIYQILALYQDRSDWLRWKGYRQWNNYMESHPKESFQERIDKGEYYVVKKGDEIVGGFILGDACEFWKPDSRKAKYLIGVVAKVGYRNVGKIIAEEAKRLTLESGNEVLRMECVFMNEKLNEIWYYHGFKYIKDVEGRYHSSLREWDSTKEVIKK